MKHLLKVWLLAWFLIYTAQPIQAQSIIIRALLPNPVGDESGEWILLENVSQATQSGQFEVGDGAGQTKSYAWEGDFSPGELMLSKETTKLSLNNDLDWVELWWNDVLIMASESYENLTEGYVWTNTGSGWQSMTAAEFASRRASGNWGDLSAETEASADNESDEETQIKVTPSPTQPSPSTRPSSTQSNNDQESANQDSHAPNSPTELEIDYQAQLASHQLMERPASSVSATSSAQLLSYPQIDSESEQQQFYHWQRQAMAGNLLLLFAGGSFCLVSVPVLWRWYNDKQCLW